MALPLGTEDLYKMLRAHGHEPSFSAGGSAAEHPLEFAHGAGLADVSELIRKPLAEQELQNHSVGVSQNRFFGVIKKSWPYAVIFVAAFFLFMTMFTTFSFSSFFASSRIQTAPKTMQSQNYPNLPQYRAWINSYFYEVTDAKVLDPNNDISGNGLTNYQKFVLGLNPRSFDTAGLGKSDTQSLIEGLNPLSGSALSDNEKKIIAEYVDLESLSNKLSLAAASGRSQVAGASTYNSDLGSAAGFDISKDGRLNIPSIDVSAPLIWTTDPKNFDADLQNGLVHYPGTAFPGQNGTAYISGHSSNYVWAQGKFNNILVRLGELKPYDSFSIEVQGSDGKKITYHYVVMSSQIYKADDQAQFANNGSSVVALSTCWPVGTSAKRLVVFGRLSQVDKQ